MRPAMRDGTLMLPNPSEVHQRTKPVLPPHLDPCSTTLSSTTLASWADMNGILRMRPAVRDGTRVLPNPSEVAGSICMLRPGSTCFHLDPYSAACPSLVAMIVLPLLAMCDGTLMLPNPSKVLRAICIYLHPDPYSTVWASPAGMNAQSRFCTCVLLCMMRTMACQIPWSCHTWPYMLDIDIAPMEC